MKKRIVFATGNAGKMKEIKMILGDLGMPVVSMKEADIEADIVEDGTSFAENAQIKASAVFEKCHDIVLADDSGLEIDYLNKEPGIYSARYMGEDTSYHIKNANLISHCWIVLRESLMKNVRQDLYVRLQRPCRMVPVKW